MNTAIVFLTRENGPHEFAFLLNTCATLSVTRMVVTDHPALDADCHKCGFINSMYAKGITHIQKNPVSLDKALMQLCRDHDFDFVWLFEDDCFVPSADALQNLMDKYQGNDLVIREHKPKTTPSLEWHWKNIEAAKIPRPWFQSMACAVGLSRSMLNVIHNHATIHKTLFYHEVMFNTLADHHGLKICTPPELQTIAWQGAWGVDHVLQLPNNIFHPVPIPNQDNLRELVKLAQKNSYQPADVLPAFLKEDAK